MKRSLGPQDSDWVHQHPEKYHQGPGLGFSVFHKNLVGDIPTIKKEIMSNEPAWAQQPFAGPFSPAMYGAMKRGSKVRASYVPYEKYGKRRVASYPRKRASSKRKYTPKYGKRGSRFYYSRYNPKSYYVRGSAANVKRFGSTWRKGTKTQQLARKRVGYYGRGKYGVFRNVYNFVKQPSFRKGFQRGFGYGADALSIAAVAEPALQPFARAGQAASGYMGRGMYRTNMPRNPFEYDRPSRNQLISGGAANTPVMQSSGYDGSLMVSHRELVQEVYGAGTVGATTPSGFEVTTLTVNPGLERVFPWLSQLAANFEEYEIHQCVFEYEGRKMVGTTDELTIHGTVTAAHKFNFKAQEFQDKHEMQSYPHANQTQAHQSLAHGVEADPGKIVGDGHKFVRLGGLLATDDQRDYDHCKFSLAQSNIPAELAAKEIGCLYVAYTVKLMKPKLHANRGLAIKTFRAVTTPGVTLSSTNKYQNVLGSSYDEHADGSTTALAPFAKNTLDMTVKRQILSSGGATVSDNTFVFPPNSSGVYKVIIRVEATSGSLGGDLHSAVAGQIVPYNATTLTDVIFMQGQLSTVSGLFAAGTTSAGGAAAVSLTSPAANTNNRRVILEFLIKVKPQVGAIENAFALKFIGDSGTIGQSSIEITEYNTFGEDVSTVGR